MHDFIISTFALSTLFNEHLYGIIDSLFEEYDAANQEKAEPGCPTWPVLVKEVTYCACRYENRVKVENPDEGSYLPED